MADELKLGQHVDPENLPELTPEQVAEGWHFEELRTMEGTVTIIAGPEGWEHE